MAYIATPHLFIPPPIFLLLLPHSSRAASLEQRLRRRRAVSLVQALLAEGKEARR